MVQVAAEAFSDVAFDQLREQFARVAAQHHLRLGSSDTRGAKLVGGFQSFRYQTPTIDLVRGARVCQRRLAGVSRVRRPQTERSRDNLSGGVRVGT